MHALADLEYYDVTVEDTILELVPLPPKRDRSGGRRRDDAEEEARLEDERRQTHEEERYKTNKLRLEPATRMTTGNEQRLAAQVARGHQPVVTGHPLIKANTWVKEVTTATKEVRGRSVEGEGGKGGREGKGREGKGREGKGAILCLVLLSSVLSYRPNPHHSHQLHPSPLPSPPHPVQITLSQPLSLAEPNLAGLRKPVPPGTKLTFTTRRYYVNATLTKGGDIIPHVPTAHRAREGQAKRGGRWDKQGIWRSDFVVSEEEPKVSYYQGAKRSVARLAALTKLGKNDKGDGSDSPSRGMNQSGSYSPYSPNQSGSYSPYSPKGSRAPTFPGVGGGVGAGPGSSTKKFDAVTIQLELAALLPPRFVMRPNPEKIAAGKAREKAKKKIQRNAKAKTAKAKAGTPAAKGGVSKARRGEKLGFMTLAGAGAGAVLGRAAKGKKAKGVGIDYNATGKAIQKEINAVDAGAGRSAPLEVLKVVNTGYKKLDGVKDGKVEAAELQAYIEKESEADEE